MLCTRYTLKAAEIAYRAHAGQKDKAGMPYIFHPCYVAERMRDEATVCVALLHDVAEDTCVTLEELAKEFPEPMVQALRLLTREKDTDYFDYVYKIKANPIARAVKIADLRHNCDLTRLERGTPQYEKAAIRREKYKKALAILTEGKEPDDAPCD